MSINHQRISIIENDSFYYEDKNIDNGITLSQKNFNKYHENDLDY